MPINVAEALDSDTAEVITVERRTGGSRVNKKWVPGSPTLFKTLASAQPATSDDLQILEEGERDKVIFKFISKKPLFTTKDREGTEADVIIHKGDRWRVVSGGDWSSYGHNTVLAAKE